MSISFLTLNLSKTYQEKKLHLKHFVLEEEIQVIELQTNISDQKKVFYFF